jgi:hypothetical protein
VRRILLLAAVVGSCGGGARPFAVTRHNATDEVAKDFVVSFGDAYSSRVGGDFNPGKRTREGLVTDRVPELARATWANADGTRHCKQIRIADSAPAEFPGRSGFPELIFKIVGRDEVEVLFQVPENKRGVEDAYQDDKLLTPRRPVLISDCAQAGPG